VQIFTPIDARYVPVPKKHIFLYRGLQWEATVPCYTFTESSQADFKLQFLLNVVTYRFRDIHFLDCQNFGFWGSLKSTTPKRGKDM